MENSPENQSGTNDSAGTSNPAGTTQEPPRIPKRRQNRIVAMQFLYSWASSATHGALEDELFDFFENQECPREFYSFAEELIAGTFENLQRIDGIIADAAKNWQIERIARCDLAILRLAIYELLYRTDIPPVVSINEAIDLAKVFSTEESHRFVNGVLDKVKGGLVRPLREAAGK